MLIEEALDNGVLIQKGQWFVVPAENKEDDALFSIQGMKKLTYAVKHNEDNVIALLSANS